MKEILIQLAYQQKERLILSPFMIERDLAKTAKDALLSDNRILVVTGMRRTGKSTLLKQLIGTVPDYCYFNFEEEKLINFKVEDFNLIEEALMVVYGFSNYWFFDEIQNIANFETAIRRMQDQGRKIVITGSNAALLSIEFGTKLTGRYKQIEIFPFSFTEFLRFEHVSVEEKDFYLIESTVKLRGLFLQWMEEGGLPEYLKFKDQDYVRTLFENILFRDIIVRYGIRRHREFRELVQMLVSNLTSPVTFSSLQKALGLSNCETVKEYMGYLANAYIVYELHQYHDSLRKQFANPRKVYLNDPVFHNLAGFSNTANLGRKLENAVFLGLRRTATRLFYYKGKNECDFIVFDNYGKSSAIQVCYYLNNENESRELGGLLEAMSALGIKDGQVLTFDQESAIKHGEYILKLKPVWKWMLQDS